MTDARDLIVIADGGPLIRLAAAQLLDAMRLTNRLIVIVDMVEDEACNRHPDKPHAADIRAWIGRMGEAVQRPETGEGIIVEALRSRAPTTANQQALKKRLRDSGERAIRDYIESIEPQDVNSVLVLHEDQAVPRLMRASNVPLRLMTTRAFVQMMIDRGLNRDAAAALEEVAGRYNVEPAMDLWMHPFGAPTAD